MKRTIKIQGANVVVFSQQKEDYISLTDIARYKDSRTDYLISNWLRNRMTVEFLGLWEIINNPKFKPIEFDGFRKQTGLNSFILSPKQWITKTNAIGIISTQGRYGGTFAHKDIAFEFATWISVEFKLYLIKEYQRLKTNENADLDWDVRRQLTKINYEIHTNAIKENLIPPTLSKSQIQKIYENEADLLNMALFGKTSREWKQQYPNKEGNLREYANITQLVCLSNLESINAVFIEEKIPPAKRLNKLNQIAIKQMNILINNKTIERIPLDKNRQNL